MRINANNDNFWGKKYRITMGPELLQRKLPLRVPTVALPSSDLSLSKSYEEGQRSVRGVVISVVVILCPTVIVLLHSTDYQQIITTWFQIKA